MACVEPSDRVIVPSLPVTPAPAVAGPVTGGQIWAQLPLQFDLVLVSGTNGITVSANPSDTVVLRSLDINGVDQGLSGVNILQAGKVVVENVKIQGFAQAAVRVDAAATNTSVLVQGSQLLGNAAFAVSLVELPMPGRPLVEEKIGVPIAAEVSRDDQIPAPTPASVRFQ